MMNFAAEVEVALSGTGTIPKAEYERWIRGDLCTRARVYIHLVSRAALQVSRAVSQTRQ